MNQSSETDKTVDIETEKQKRQLERQSSIENSLQLNVKDHMVKLDQLLNDLKNQLSQGKVFHSNLRMEVMTLKSQHAKDSEDTIKYSQNQVSRLGTDLQKRSLEIAQEVDFMDAQYVTIVVDKKKLDDNAVTLESRIQQCESDVGFRHVYD